MIPDRVIQEEFPEISSEDYWKHSDQVEVFFDAVDQEMLRQIGLWGFQNHPDGTGDPRYREMSDRFREIADSKGPHGDLTWRDIILEEMYEALAEDDPQKLREELVQCAAVLGSWIRDLDTRQ